MRRSFVIDHLLGGEMYSAPVTRSRRIFLFDSEVPDFDADMQKISLDGKQALVSDFELTDFETHEYARRFNCRCVMTLCTFFQDEP